VYAASWYGSSAYLIPKDLSALQETVERLRAKVFEGCEGAQSISRQKTATATMAAGEERTGSCVKRVCGGYSVLQERLRHVYWIGGGSDAGNW
jgi:hypothetical protein